MRKRFNLLSLLMTFFLTVSIVIYPPIAQAKTIYTPQGTLEIKVISDSEVQFISKIDNKIYKTVALKMNNDVYYNYYENDKLTYEKKIDVHEASEIGEAIKQEYVQKIDRMENNKITSLSITSTQPYSRGTWDGLNYVGVGVTGCYAHPDKTYYNILSNRDWSKEGTKYKHVQIDCYDSGKLVDVPSYGIWAGIGAAVGAYVGGIPGATFGAILGAGFGVFTSNDIKAQLFDENGCIWAIFDKSPTVTTYEGDLGDIRTLITYNYIQIGSKKLNFFSYVKP